MGVEKFPKRRVYDSTVSAKDIWAQPEPAPELVWAICPYLRSHHDESRCHHCPPWEQDKHHGNVQRGCYGLAAEACRIISAMQKRASHG